MNNINKFFAVIFAISSVFFASCAVYENDADRESSPASPDGAQFYIFDNTPSSLSFLPSDEQKFVIKVGRDKTVAESAATIELVIDDPDNAFTLPSAITFEAGATESDIPVTFNFDLGQKSTLTVSFAESDAYVYGKSKCTISVLRDYVWVSAGVAEMTSSWAGTTVDVPIQFAQGSNPFRYRLESPYYYLEPDYCEFPGYNIVFELDENYNAANFPALQEIGEEADNGNPIMMYGFTGNSFTNVGNVFTIIAHFVYVNGSSYSGWANMKETFVWKEGYPGKAEEKFDFNALEYNDIPGAVSEFKTTAYYDMIWEQSFAQAVDIDEGNPDSKYKNLYYLPNLYADGYGLAFYYDGNDIIIPENQPTGAIFRKPIYVSQSENIESNVTVTNKGLHIYTLGLTFHHEDGTVVGEFAETFYYSENPISYNLSDFCGNFKLTGLSQFDASEPDADMDVSIAAGAGENTFIITGIDLAAEVEATFDPETSAMSIAPQELADYGPYDITLYTTTPNGDISTTESMDFTFNMSGNLVLTPTSKADGYLLRSEAAGGWVDGYYDLVFTPQATKSASIMRSYTNQVLKSSKVLKKAPVIKREKCVNGNFAIKDKTSVKKALRNNPIVVF